MLILRYAAWLISVSVMVCGAGLTWGQDYPNKLIRIFTSPPGGGTDATTRIIAQALSPHMGQPVIVENRPMLISIETVSKSPPDGYAILLQGDFIYFEPLIHSSSVYDPERDFSPITMVSTEPQVLVVHPSLPVKSVRELVALAKARPGQLNYATNGVGSVTHLAAALLANMAHINIVHVPYKSTGGALGDLLGGFVQMRFNGVGGIVPHIKTGKVRALAVSSAQPSALISGLPTIAESVPGYSFVSMVGIFAPAKTPPAIITRLNQELVRTINQPDVKEKLVNAPSDVVAGPPEQLATYVKTESARWSKVIKEAGIKIE